MKTPHGIEIGKKYCIYHVSNSLDISTIVSEFKVIDAKKECNTIIIHCEPVRQAKHKPESFGLRLDKYNDLYVLHPKLRNVGEED